MVVSISIAKTWLEMSNFDVGHQNEMRVKDQKGSNPLALGFGWMGGLSRAGGTAVASRPCFVNSFFGGRFTRGIYGDTKPLRPLA